MKINRVITCTYTLTLIFFLIATVEVEADLALDFASFLLRYHKDLEYADFTEDNNVQDLIRRAEAFRQWADIEDLAASIDNITSVFEQHRTTAANAMQEIF